MDCILPRQGTCGLGVIGEALGFLGINSESFVESDPAGLRRL